MVNEEKLKSVARFIEGDMNGQELVDFEILLSQDPALQEMVATYNDVHETLKIRIAPDEDDLKVQARLSDLNSQYFKKQIPNVKLFTYLKWASVAAILVIGLFLWAPWSGRLYDKYAISREMSVTERGNEENNQLQKAATLYNDKDFESAAKILEKEYLLKPDHALIAYYYGLSLIQCNQEEKARDILLKLYSGESVFKYDALYNIGLSYVKQDQNSQALIWLSKIGKENRNYEQAQKLIREIK